MSELVLHTLDGLAFAMLMFLVASGLTLVFGLMRVVNLAHGALYLVGAYIGYLVQRETHSFYLALLVAPLAVGAIAWLVELLLRGRLYGEELPQVLLTIGLALMAGDAIQWIGGGAPRSIQEPGWLSGSVTLSRHLVFPTYRLAIIVLGALVAIVLGLVWQRTRVGALLRAGVDDPTTLEALGVNVGRLFMLTFVGGAALAGLAGVVGGAFIGLHPGLDFDVLLYSLVIVVLGGLGSLRGALVGALVIGLADSYAKAYLPELSYFVVFGPAVLVLAVRPTGLFGARA
jgi:branched-chain amino acid transport system permease protein